MKRLQLRAGLGAAVMLAATTAGCGSAHSGTSTTSSAAHTTTATPTTTVSARARAVKFAECLRTNGVGDFPDPNASGQFPSYGVSVTETVWKRAVAACKSLQPPGTLSAKMTPAEQSAALEFARCVRKHGVPDFPDPVNGQPLIDTNRIPSANRPGGMTILNAATHACGRLLARQTGGGNGS